MKIVELRPGYAWDCAKCGKRNFGSCIVPESPKDSELMQQIQEILHEMSPDFELKPMATLMPVEVECEECKSVFETIDDLGGFRDEQ